MRNVRSLMFVAATLAATGCLHETTATSNAPEAAETQPQPPETAPSAVPGQGPTATEAQPTPGPTAGTAGQPGAAGPMAPQPAGPDAHSLVLGAVSCVTQGAVSNAALLGVGGGPSAEESPSSEPSTWGSSGTSSSGTSPSGASPSPGMSPSGSSSSSQRPSMGSAYGGQPQVQSGTTQSTQQNAYGGRPMPSGQQQTAPMQNAYGGQPAPSGTMQPGTMQPGTMQPGAMQPGMQGRGMAQPISCNGLAMMANVPPSALRAADPSAVRQVRDIVERQASQDNLDDITRMHLLSLFDKTVAASREEMVARKVADHYAAAAAERTQQTTTSSSSRSNHNGTSRSSNKKNTHATHAPTIDPADAATLSSHDNLRDLVEFGRTANVGPIGSEAEAVAWLLATDRFLMTEQLPPSGKVLAAEPLFDTFFGVTAPSAASSGTASKTTWTQYLNRAAQAARTLGSPAMGGMGGGPQSSAGTSEAGTTTSSSRGTSHTQRTTSAQDLANFQTILGAAEQQIDMLANRIPPSELKVALNGYVQQLRSGIGVGGGPRHGMPGGGGMTPGMGPSQGMPSQGMPSQGMPSQGMPSQGMPSEGMPSPTNPSYGNPPSPSPSPAPGGTGTGAPGTSPGSGGAGGGGR